MALLLFACWALAIATVLRLYLNWRELSNTPGPLLASLTDFWRAWYQYNGQLRVKLVELHKRYGPIVRYGVRSVSISDPSIVDAVYGSRAGFTTADSYNVLIGIKDGKEVPSLVSTADEGRHGQLRRSVANAFTVTNVLDYEPRIDTTILELQDFLQRRSGSTLDLTSTILHYTMDAAARFSFGAPLGCLESDSDVEGSIQVIRDRFDHWGHWSSLPWLERLVYRNPIAMRMKRAPSSMAATAVSRLKDRIAKPQDLEKSAPDLLTRFLDSSQAHPEVLDTAGIVGMLMSTISGAGDTTATAITSTLYRLMKHPGVLARLQAELARAQVDHPIQTAAQVSKLPYLNAVIKESMRVFPSTTWPIERRVPAGGATIAGTFFPEGTSLGTLPASLHLNSQIYGPDAEVYRPDRWLTDDVERLRAMEASFMGFSRGRRVCLGQHIAVMQMKKLIPMLVTSFKMSLVDPNSELEADFSPAVACLKPLMVSIDVPEKA